MLSDIQSFVLMLSCCRTPMPLSLPAQRATSRHTFSILRERDVLLGECPGRRKATLPLRDPHHLFIGAHGVGGMNRVNFPLTASPCLVESLADKIDEAGLP
jgi:hypothetical protein